jgi:hypothetical protein
MAITYNVAVKNSRMTATRDYFASGKIEILTSGDALLVEFPISSVGGSVASGTWTLTFGGSATASHSSAASAGGVAAKAQIKNSGGTAHITGLTVGTSGADIILDNTNIAVSQNVTINSASITHAA